MKCAWKELLSILPPWLRGQADKYSGSLQEIRLRLGKDPQLICANGGTEVKKTVTTEDLSFVMNTACRYSPWTASGAAACYITAPGGHRVGLCGEAVVQGGVMTGVKSLSSLNIRVARDFPGCAEVLADVKGSAIILGRPGSGKTTLLRDLIRQLSAKETVAVVDERGELFPTGLDTGQAVDILTGCPKPLGLDVLVRTMTPDILAVDEITAQSDCEALVQTLWCGVRLLATAHASGKQDLLSRAVYRPLVQTSLFSTLIIMQPDKSFRIERMQL